MVGAAETPMAQGLEADGGKAVQALMLPAVEVKLLEDLAAIGEAMSPPVRRNPLIIWILEQYRDGHLVVAERGETAGKGVAA